MKFSRIRKLREDEELTQEEMAEYLSVRQTTYSKYECGRINIPLETLIQLADFYKVSLDYLVGRTDDKKIVQARKKPQTLDAE